jgi:hypothetical protein
VGYRLDSSSGSVAFLPDSEPYDSLKIHSIKSQLLSPEQMRKRAEEARAELVEFLRDCDVLVLDTQYTDDEYKAHVGWGHGSLSTAVALAADAGVRKLLLFHHDPAHDDNAIDKMVAIARKIAAKTGKGLQVDAAREGLELALAGA